MRGHPWDKPFQLDVMYALRTLFLEMQRFVRTGLAWGNTGLRCDTLMTRFGWSSPEFSMMPKRSDVRWP